MIHRTARYALAITLSAAALLSVNAHAQETTDTAAKPPVPVIAAPPSSEDTLLVLGLRPLEPLRFVNPLINGIDAANGKEAWIHLQVKVSAIGDVTDAKVVDAFPKNSYEKAVLKVAPGWRFPPFTKDGKLADDATYHIGIAFYFDTYEDQRLDSPRAGTKRTVSRYNYTTLDNLIKDLTGTLDLEAAGPRLEKLRLRYEGGDMTITDIARYYAAMARYERLRGNYNTSLAAAHGALLLSRFLDNRKMIYSLHLEVMSSLLSMGRNDDAVDYYNRWRLITKIPMTKEGQDMMEQLRAQGAGKGHPYTIVDFDAAHRYNKRPKVMPRTQRVCFGVDTPSGTAACGDVPEPVLQTSVELISFDFPNVLDPGPLAKPVASNGVPSTGASVQ
jgi:TonB family protein